uniref:coiled-coil domain-containing protein 175 n=1 Tax=Pristiophorus japonicus TaxID=55135 RepID=UPI00398E3B67
MNRCQAQLPTVTLALQHLRELKKQLKKKNICFDHESVRLFKRIAEGISQLEEARRHIHEVLEVETIEASKLRYKLFRLPNKLNQQIAAAVATVHESKATQLKELQAKIETMTQQVESLEKEYYRLEKENASLCPIQQKAGARYDDIISLLNNLMEERTSHQITMNETYDNIRNAQQQTLRTSRDNADLKEDMEREKKEFEIEKKSLMEKFTEIHLQVQHQNTINNDQRNKLDKLNVELYTLNHKVSTQIETAKQLDIEHKYLKEEEVSLERKYSEAFKATEELVTQKNTIADELNTLIENLRQESEYLHTRFLQAQKDINDAQVLNQKLVENHATRNEAFKKAKENETETSRNVLGLRERLNPIKDLLAQNEENLSHIRKQIQEHEEVILSLLEKHKDAMDLLNGEMQKYTNKFEKEEQVRVTTQRNRDEISKEIMFAKGAMQNYLANMSLRTVSLKKKRESLIAETKRLQKEIDEYAKKIAALRQQCAAEENTISNNKQILATESEQLKNEIEDVKQHRMQQQEELQAKMSIQQDIESNLAEETAVCAELHKVLEDLQQEKYDIDNTLIHLKIKTGMLLSSKVVVKSRLSAVRNRLFNQVKNTAEQMKFIEVDIYEAGRRLEHVTIENCKLKLCNFQLIKNIASLNEETEKQKAEKKEQDLELQIIYDNLLKSWALDASVQKENEACDQCVQHAMEELLKKIHHREQTVGSIRDQLKEHLSRLLSFVGSTHSTEETKKKCMIKQTKSLQ